MKSTNPNVETNFWPKTSKNDERIMSTSNVVIRIDARIRVCDPEISPKQFIYGNWL